VGLRHGLVERCQNRGDTGCSVPCGSTKRPSVHFVRHGVRHNIFGCPQEHVCASALKFESDFRMRKNGHLSPFDADNLPAKYETMLGLYETWKNFFYGWAQKQSPDYKPPTQKAIEAYRATQRR